MFVIMGGTQSGTYTLAQNNAQLGSGLISGLGSGSGSISGSAPASASCFSDWQNIQTALANKTSPATAYSEYSQCCVQNPSAPNCVTLCAETPPGCNSNYSYGWCQPASKCATAPVVTSNAPVVTSNKPPVVTSNNAAVVTSNKPPAVASNNAVVVAPVAPKKASKVINVSQCTCECTESN